MRTNTTVLELRLGWNQAVCQNGRNQVRTVGALVNIQATIASSLAGQFFAKLRSLQNSKQIYSAHKNK